MVIDAYPEGTREQQQARWAAPLRERPVQVTLVTAAPRTPTAGAAALIAPASQSSPALNSSHLPDLPADLCLPPDAQAPTHLAPDAIPSALADTIRWLPYVDGARWTYECTQSLNLATWERGLKRVSIQGRWRLAKDAMLVQLRVEAPAEAIELFERAEWTIVIPGGSFPVATCREGATTLQQQRAVLRALDLPLVQSVANPWESLQLAARDGMDKQGHHWSLDGVKHPLPSRWRTPAGVFQGCKTLVSELMGNGRSHLCPGVGWMGGTHFSMAGGLGLRRVEMLVDYDIPRWRVIP